MHVLFPFPTPRRMSVNKAASDYSFFMFSSYLAMQKIKNTSMDDSTMDFIFCYAVWGGYSKTVFGGMHDIVGQA